jgi:hypothetical protein
MSFIEPRTSILDQQFPNFYDHGNHKKYFLFHGTPTSRLVGTPTKHQFCNYLYLHLFLWVKHDCVRSLSAIPFKA